MISPPLNVQRVKIKPAGALEWIGHIVASIGGHTLGGNLDQSAWFGIEIPSSFGFIFCARRVSFTFYWRQVASKAILPHVNRLRH